MLSSNVAKAVHVDRMTEEMNRDDCTRARSDERFNQIKIEVPGFRFGIDRNGNEIIVIGRERGCDVVANAVPIDVGLFG